MPFSLFRFLCIIISVGCVSSEEPTIKKKKKISTSTLRGSGGISYNDSGSILVTGAAGRTGSHIYKQLKEIFGEARDVRAFVRSEDRAREVLNCTICDETEGIFVGDVTDATSMLTATLGVSTVVIAVGASPLGNPTSDDIKRTEFTSVQNTVVALAQPRNKRIDINNEKRIDHLRVVLCSSMGTTNNNHKHGEAGEDVHNGHGRKLQGNEHDEHHRLLYDDHESSSSNMTKYSINPKIFDDIIFWKLNAETFLESTGIGSTIVKPCGLVDKSSGNVTLITGHDDKLLNITPPIISRADVASVISQAVIDRTAGLRFDLCSINGVDESKPQDLSALLKNARWEWQLANIES